MVLIGGIKYACERCIRGHRVTTCNHTDQPLMMIKPKGRPSSQCKHCKDMRKNKNNHSSGACTCGGRAKKSGSVVGKQQSHHQNNHCGCDDGEPCKCHGKRKETSPPSASSNGIDKLPAGLLKEKKTDLSTHKVRQIGMDPLAAAKPTTETTRTRVGEVSIPLNEYIPSNHHGIGNVSDTLPEGFFQDVPMPFEPGHGLLDMFSDHGKQQQQQQQKQKQKKHTQPGSEPLEKSLFNSDFKRSSQTSSLSPDSNTANPIQSPIEGIDDFFPYFPMSTSSSTEPTTASSSSVSNGIHIPQSQHPKRNSSITSRSSSSLDTSRRQISISESLDSLLTQDLNHHHYEAMIHKPSTLTTTTSNNSTTTTTTTTHPQDTLFGTFERDLQQHHHNRHHHTSNTNNTHSQQQPQPHHLHRHFETQRDDQSSRSVEVLSLTPTFMDIPNEFKDVSYFNSKSVSNGAAGGTSSNTTSLTNGIGGDVRENGGNKEFIDTNSGRNDGAALFVDV